MRTRRLGKDPQLQKVDANTLVLARGATGSGVAAVQDLLADLGHVLVKSMSRKGADGLFGPETEGVVKAFQTKSGLSADGKVGPKTLDALERAIENDPSLEVPSPEAEAALVAFDAVAPVPQKRTVYL